MAKINGISLFSGAGIGELNLNKTNVHMVLAVELLKQRCSVYAFWHKKTEVLCGDVTSKEIIDKIIDCGKRNNVQFLMITPPCQGVSLIGKNKSNDDMLEDSRNFLIFSALEVVDRLQPNYILIENVPRYLKLLLPFNGGLKSILEILKIKYGEKYTIKENIFNCADYGIAQTRERAIIRLYKNGLVWNDPKKEEKITVRQAIGDLPSLESGEKSNIKNHNARVHTKEHILCMKHTATGHSAFENKVYFPKKRNGVKAIGYMASYKRIEWDKPAPTITMRNDAISSQSNVHPGRLLPDGTYSDARVLTLREIFILSSINPDIDIPSGISESQIRYMVGEAVPPRLIEKILKGIK